jgi:WD40 repeat protein
MVIMATKREPYVGPRPFEEKDREVFFGRDGELEELVSLISAHQAVLLYALSGVGKTSLVKASLIPTLINKERFEVLPAARVRSHETRPRMSKIQNIYIYNALGYLSQGQLSELQRANMTLAQFLESRRQTDRNFLSYFKRRREPVDSSEVRSQCVLIFDQFEELFTLYPERFEDRKNFFEQVRDALQVDKVLRVVFAMREDYIAQLDPYLTVLPEKLRTRFRLEPLKQATALEAIQNPLRERLPNDEFRERSFDGVQRKFAEGVAEQLVTNLQTIQVKTPDGEKDVLGEFIDPVQLQIVCQTLWRKLKRDVREITHEHLRLYGDVSAALGNFYVTCIKAAAAKAKMDQADLRVLFERALITSSGRRGMIYRADKDSMVAGIPVAAIDELEDQHIIRAELRSDERWYELSHDRFIQPIRDANKDWRMRQPFAQQLRDELETQTAEWIRAGRDRNLLLRGVEANDAKQWLGSPEATAVGYSPELYAFVTDSHAARQQRSARKMRLALGGAVVVALLMIGLTAYGAIKRREAETLISNVAAVNRKLEVALEQAKVLREEEAKQRKLADEKRMEAESFSSQLTTAVTKAENAQAEAIKERNAARAAEEQQARQKGIAQQQTTKANVALQIANSALDGANSLVLAAKSINKSTTNPELGLQFAIEAVALERNPETEDALYATYPLVSTVKPLIPSDTDTPLSLEVMENAVFTSDNSAVITVSKTDTEHKLTIWNAITGTLATSQVVANAMVSRDGKFIAVLPKPGDNDNSLVVSEIVKENENISVKPVAKLKGDTGNVVNATFSPDNRCIVAISDDQKARVWQTTTGHQLTLLDNTQIESSTALKMKRAVVSSECRFALTMSEGGKGDDSGVVIWNLKTGKPIAELIIHDPFGHDTSINDAIFSPQGNLFVTAGADRTARLWESSTGRELQVLRGHTDMVSAVAFSSDGALIVTGSNDSTARVWQAANGDIVTEMRGHTGSVRNVSFSLDNKLVATSSDDGTARIWQARTGEEVNVLRGHTGVVNSAVFNSNGSSIVTASNDDSARIWEVSASQGVFVLSGHTARLLSGVFSKSGEFVVTASGDQTARVWSARTKQLVDTLVGNKGPIWRASFSLDDSLIVTAGDDGTARIWQREGSKDKWRNVQQLNAGQGHVTAEFTGDGKFLVTTAGELIRMWRTNNLQGNPVAEYSHSYNIYGSALSPKFVDGAKEKLLALACGNGKLIIFDVETGKEKDVFDTKTGYTFRAAFSPDGDLVAVSIDNNTAQVWDIRSKKLVQTLVGHSGTVIGLAFSPDGKFLVTASHDNTAKVWEASTGQLVRTLTGHTDNLYDAEFSPDGRSIITASGDTTARIYQHDKFIPFTELLRLAEKRVPRRMTPKELERYLRPNSAALER